MARPVGILWDMENCSIPVDVSSDDVAGNIRTALRVHPAVEGSVTMFSAYGDFNHFPRRLREGCQRTGINLIDVPNGRKDASDKAILVDMFLFALDNPPPCTILLISGDVDFAPALHKLGQRGYTVVLALPTRLKVAAALCSAGRYVWDWPSVARGGGFVPEEVLPGRLSSPDFVGTLQSSDDSDHLNEDEARRCSQNGPVGSCGNAAMESGKKGSPSGGTRNQRRKQGSTTNVSAGRAFNSRSTGRDPCEVENETFKLCGDFEGLKGQFVKLLEQNGGSVDFAKLPSLYSRAFQKRLCVSDYGSLKLAHLLIKMQDVLLTVGDDVKKVCLRKYVPGEIQAQVTEDGGCGGSKGETLSLEADPDSVEEVILLRARNDSGPRAQEGGGHCCAKAMQSKFKFADKGCSRYLSI